MCRKTRDNETSWCSSLLLLKRLCLALLAGRHVTRDTSGFYCSLSEGAEGVPVRLCKGTCGQQRVADSGDSQGEVNR
jgi:hypothetical protein